MGWQPIETAPKDGTDVLLAGTGTYDVTVGSFYKATKGPSVCDGWYYQDGSSRIEPTHWMPLPPPPGGGG